MTIPTLPLNQFKANLELQAKLAKLVQENHRQWLGVRERLADEGIADSDALVAQLLQVEDWQKLVTSPAVAFWHQLEQRFGDTQAVAQVAVSAQTAFTQGLQEALRAWQQETVSALRTSVSPGSLDGYPRNELLKPWQQWLAVTTKGGSPRGRAGT